MLTETFKKFIKKLKWSYFTKISEEDLIKCYTVIHKYEVGAKDKGMNLRIQAKEVN